MSTREKPIAEADYSSASALVVFEAMAEETSVSPLRHADGRDQVSPVLTFWK
jgi:hypothetical protein